ncbi:MAG: hypothetical protein QOD54_1347 [Sphingomonadales bacterium]|jgi:gamma-glutamylcyclotransferase (GGCT)/AIG2-like uncharacterized protein YtfP|nr:hypothetical protein [Sphingomonadales bacterium]
MSVSLFSYGTLQQREVQLATYGRELSGAPDVLAGYRLTPLAISDPRVVSLSGKAVHSIARATGDPNDRIPGMLFEISEAELAAADAYEVALYSRTQVRLESGRSAFVYVGAPFGSSD